MSTTSAKVLSTRAAAVAAVAVLALGAAARAETLADAIALAYQTNPTLLAQQAALRGVDETYVQARAGYGPTVTLQASVTTDNTNVPQSLSFGSQLTYETQTSNGAIVLSQPLYTGGRVAREVDAAQATVMAGREALRATEQTLLQTVIQAYVAVRHDQRALAIARDTLGLLERQQAEIDARYKVGEITRTDVAQTQERVAVARSLAVAAEVNLEVSRASYLQTVGQLPGTLDPEPPLDKLLPKTFDAADAAVLAANPQLRQALFTERASAAKVAAAKAQTRPTLSLQGSGGYTGGNLGLHTPFAQFGYNLTASAVASMPISTAGLTSSLIRQAVETNSVDRIGIETARRQALFNAAQAWRQMSGLLESVTIDQQAVDAAKIAFEGSSQEGKLGLRTTLDVLIAEQDLYSAEITLADAQRDAYVAEAALLNATGGLRVEAFAPDLARYAPERYFDRVSRTPLWSPWEPAVAAFDHLAAPGEAPPPPPPKP